MARLTDEPYDMPEYDDYESWEKYNDEQKARLDEVRSECIRFPVADGSAIYRVVELEHVEPCECCGRGGEPLLQHVPFGDAYRISGSHIRGLTTEDVKKRL